MQDVFSAVCSHLLGCCLSGQMGWAELAARAGNQP